MQYTGDPEQPLVQHPIEQPLHSDTPPTIDRQPAQPAGQDPCWKATLTLSGWRVKSAISPAPPPATGTSRSRTARPRCAAPCSAIATSGSSFTPDNGDAIRLRCRVSLYEGRGEFQLIVEHLEHAGAGALQAAFEKLKASYWRRACSTPSANSHCQNPYPTWALSPPPPAPPYTTYSPSCAGAARHRGVSAAGSRCRAKEPPARSRRPSSGPTAGSSEGRSAGCTDRRSRRRLPGGPVGLQ